MYDYEIDLDEGRNNYVEKKNNTTKVVPRINIVVRPGPPIASPNPSPNPTTPTTPTTSTTSPVTPAKKVEPIPLHKEFIALTILNIYEYFLGLTLGFILNEIFYRLVKFEKGENLTYSFLMLTICVAVIITIIVIARRSSAYVPGVSDVYNHPDFKHPPPIALTFSLWRTINQIKKRSGYIQDIAFQILDR